MIPDGGWDTSYADQGLIAPRDQFKLPLVARATLFSDSAIIHTLTYNRATRLMEVADADGLVYYTNSTDNILSLDLAFDQEDRPVLTWQAAQSIIWLQYYDTVSASIENLTFDGNNPCCCVDNVRDNLASESDVIVFYQIGSLIMYRVQREDYATAHTVTQFETGDILDTCGMDEGGKLSLRMLSSNAVFFGSDEKVMMIGDQMIGYPEGVNPWHRS